MEFRRIRKGVPVSSTIISLSMTVLFGLSVPPAVGADEASFSTVVQSCFSSWVPDGSGLLTPSRIEQLIFNHQVKGDEAAAVASIHVYFRMNKAARGLSKDDLVREDPVESLDEDSHLPQPRGFNARFRKFSQHLKMAPRTIFTNGGPRLEGIHQGPLGDCWVVSAIGAAVHAHPLRLKEMIRTEPDGSCTVEFRDGKSIRVNPLTDSQIALSSTAGDQGLWLNVLEQAFGQVRKALIPKDRNMLGLDAISSGGNACRSITRLTGHGARKFDIRRVGAKDLPPDLRRRPELVAEVRNVIQDAVAKKLLICAGTSVQGEFPPGIGHPHDYAVLDYNRDSDAVTLWNPHASNFEPEGSPGLINGYAMGNGILRMPLHDFTLVFGALFVETPRPYEEQTALSR